MDHAPLARMGMDALRRGDAQAARAAFQTITQAGATHPQPWLLLAQSCALLDDDPATDTALDEVLKFEPRNLYALLMKGDVNLRRGDERAASSWYSMATSSASGLNVPRDLVPRLAAAESAVMRVRERFAGHLDDALAAHRTAAGPRFGEAIGILTGEKQVFLQAPTSFYFPGLAPRPFFDGAEFPWVKTLEDAAPAVTAELSAVLRDGDGLQPYVEPQHNRPNKGHALLGDPSWSAFHLIENGKPVAGNAERCPATMALLAAMPMPRVAGRSPMALFSVLKPRTHIPPHSGMLNTRLIVHLPLIVPQGCRLRVGNEVRDVMVGKSMIFDDSIEHEAWNDSDETRVVLLFEIWRPDLSLDERAALVAMFEAIESYGVASPLSR